MAQICPAYIYMSHYAFMMLSCNFREWAFYFMFLREPYVSLSRVRWKKYIFDNFQVFFIAFDHVNACESMRSLVQIHNRQYP